MNIYVGNLAWKTRQKELKELFENFGEVTNAFIVRDKVTRRSRGFGFVEMAEEKDARQAIEKLNNTVFLDRTIIVNEALPKDDENESDESGDEAASENETAAAENTEDPEEETFAADDPENDGQDADDPKPVGEDTDDKRPVDQDTDDPQPVGEDADDKKPVGEDTDDPEKK